MTVPGQMTLLWRASIEGGLLVLAVLAVTRLVPRMPAAARCALWWLASLRLLVGLVALPSLFVSLPALPSLPSATASVARASVEAVALHSPVTDAIAPAAIAASRLAPRTAAPPRSGSGLPLAAFTIWLAGLLGVIALHLRAGRRLAHQWREAGPVESPAARAWLAAWLGEAEANRIGLRASDAVSSPLLMGGSSPRILVPRSCLSLEPGRLRMVLAHEVSHIQRRDLLWGAVPVLAQGVFWFHPLAHWCVSEYAQAREEACDAGALRLSDEAPHRYGELLLEFGVDHGRHALTAPSYGSSHAAQLKRRLHMLAHAFRPSAGQRALAAGALIVFGALALAPVRLVASPRPREAHVDRAEAPATAPVPATIATASSRATAATPATAPSPASAVVAASASGRSRSSRSSSSSSFGYSISDDPSDDFSYGYARGGTMSMSGTFDDSDSEWLDQLKSRGLDEYAFFRFDRRTYLVTDADVLEQMRELLRAETELGRRQGELGAQQGKLGALQGELGAAQGELGSEQGRTAELQARLDEELARDRHDESRRGVLQREKAELQARIRALQDRVEELSQRQRELGARQRELGKLQSELGRQQQARARETRERMRELARQLIEDGRAELVQE